MKRMLSLLLAVAMCVSLLPTLPVSAAKEAPIGTTYEYDFTKDTVNTVGTAVPLNCFTDYDAVGTVPSTHASLAGNTYDMTGRNWHFLKLSDDSKWQEPWLWTVGLYLVTKKANEWVALKVRVPKSGEYSVALDNYTGTGYMSGEMFILPADASEADYLNADYKYADIINTTASQTSAKTLVAGKDNSEFVLVLKVNDINKNAGQGQLAPLSKITLVKTAEAPAEKAPIGTTYKYDFTKDTVNTVGTAVPLSCFTDYDAVGTVPSTHASLAGNTYDMTGRNWHFLKLSNDSKWQEPWLWTVGLYLPASAANEWVALKIRVPKSGEYSVTLNNATAAGYMNGEMFILPTGASEADYTNAAYKYTDIVKTTASQTSDKTLSVGEDNEEFVLVFKINEINKNAGVGQLAPLSALTLVKAADAEDAEVEEAPLGTTYGYDFTKDTVNTVGNTVLLPYLNEYDAAGTVPGSDTTYDISGRNWHFLKFSNDSKWVEQKMWTVGLYLQSTAVNEWVAFKIRVPKAGAYSVTLDNYTNAAYKNGEMYILPADANEADYTNSKYKYTNIVKTTASQTSDKLLVAEEDNQEFVLVFKITEVGMLAPPAKLTLVKTLYKTSYDFTKDTVNTVGSAVPLQYFTDYDVVGTVPATHASLAGNTYNMVGRNWHFLKLSNESKWQEPWLWTVGLYLVAKAPNEWIAIKIRVPKAGTYSVTLDNATAAGYKNGEMYILPSDASEANYLSSAFKYTDIINTTPSQTSDKTLRVSKSNEEFVVVFKLNEINKNAGAGQLPPVSKLTLNEIEVKPALTHITADFGEVTVGDILNPTVEWFSEGKKLNGKDGTVSAEIVEGENDILLKGDNGNIYAIAEGEAKVRVTGTLEEVSQSVDVSVNVGASKPDAGVRDIKITLTDSTIGTGEITSVASVSANYPSGKAFDMSDAYISYSVAEGSEDIIESCDDGKSFKAVASGNAEIEALIIANGAMNKAKAEVSVNDEIKVKHVYLYTEEEVSADTKLKFSIRTELNNGEILGIGEIVGFEKVNESETGVLDIDDEENIVSAIKEGTAEILARVRVRGIEVKTDTVSITVLANPVQYPANFTIDFRKGTYEGDNYGYLDEIKEYTPARNWIFHDFPGKYPNERPWLASKTAKFTQFTWKTPGEGYFAFKVKFPQSGVYKIDSISSDNSRAAKLELYILPVTKENEKNLAAKLVNTSGYYVSSVDYYTEGYTPLKEDIFHSYGNANISEAGEYFVVFKNVKGKSNSLVSSYGDALYPLYFTFTNEAAMNRAELSAEGDKTVLEIDETVKLIPKLYNVKGESIDYTPESITSLTYVSGNPEVAEVAQDGTVTGLGEGKATITATIARDGAVVKANIEITVKDNSGINTEKGISVSCGDTIYVYGTTKIELGTTMNSGKSAIIPSEYITYQISGDEDAVEISDDGTVTGKNVGTAHIQPVIDAEYLESRGGSGLEISPVTVNVIWDATVDPQLYTLRERENAKKNAGRYDWAKNEVNSVIVKADYYVENIDKLYDMIVPEGLPRYYHTSHVNDPLNIYCRYCGEYVGSYSWAVNPINNPWKIQCTKCRRWFPSNDFGSFYKLGVCEDKSWSYEKALLEHHKLFVCENGEECTCTLPKSGKGSAEWYEFYGYGVPGGYLNNDLYKEMDEKLGIKGWGVDDGMGYLQPYVADKNLPGYHTSYSKDGNGNATYNNSGNKGPVRHNYIAYYLHEAVWYGAGQMPNSAAVRNALLTLRDAFLYTGEAKYGRAGAILLDRVADVFPDFDWYAWTDWRGNGYRGTIVDCTWSTALVNAFTTTYDAFLPIYNDPYVINYLAGKNAAVYESNGDGTLKRDGNGNLIAINPKSTPGALRKNVEDNILLKIFEFIKRGMIIGNTGTYQNSLVYAAIALNRQPETGEMLEWIMKMGEMYNYGPEKAPISGGQILSRLVDDVDRDGNGTENAPGYNSMWITYFMELAGTLAEYDGYEGVDLFENPKYRKMFLAQIRLLLGGYYTAQIGDWGSIGSKDIVLDLEDSLTAFKYTGDRTLARAMYLANGNTAEGLRGTIFDDDPEKITKDIEKIVEEDGEFALGSDMLTGTGFAVLRAGAKYNSASESTATNTTRDMAIYFGSNNGHGHFDALNLYMTAFGINVAPDIGYPEFTGNDPNRYQWVHATISHNTVVVNEKRNDTVTNAAGDAYHFDDAGRVKVMDVASDAYDMACDEYRRSVIMVEVDDETAYGVDFFHIVGGNDHLYSFHSQSDELYEISGLGDKKVQPTYENEKGQLVGTYAGPDVAYGPDPGGVNSERYPKGYTWLKDVRTFGSIEKDFSVEYKVKDWRKALPEKRDIRLKLTMLNDKPVDEVSFAMALPQNPEVNKVTGLDYLLVRRKGNNLDTTFTTVLEPYVAENKYIKSIEKVSMERNKEDKPGMNDSYGAVRVELENGRVDYVIYSTNTKMNYVIDGKINFRGFAGVLSLKDDEVIYSYINDGEVLSLVDTETEEKVAAYNGKVTSFTKELSSENFITFTPDENQDIDLDNIIGRYVYVENGGSENGAYRIENAREVNGDIELSIGDVSIINGFIDPYNPELGYVHNLSEGNELRIPLSSVTDTSPVFEKVSDITASAGSSVAIPLNAYSEDGKEITLIGTSLPRGMSLDKESGKLIWKPSASQVGENHVAVTASDGVLETTIHFTVTVYGSTGGTPSTPSTPSTPGSGTGSGSGAGAGSGSGTGAGSGSGAGTGNNGSDLPQTPSTETEKDVRFVDLGAHAWAESSINALAEDEIIKGTSENTFSPASNITRADFAILLVRAFKKVSDNTENFSDVLPTDYFAKELAIARNTGLVGGIGDNKFAPKAFIKRCDMMLMVYRVIGDKLNESDAPEYADFEDVPEYAREAVSALIGAGLVNGKGDKIAPNDNTTRAEVAVLLKRVLDFVAEK